MRTTRAYVLRETPVRRGVTCGHLIVVSHGVLSPRLLIRLTLIVGVRTHLRDGTWHHLLEVSRPRQELVITLITLLANNIEARSVVARVRYSM